MVDHSKFRDDGAYVFHHPPKFSWRESNVPQQAWRNYGVYLHVPFCRAICDFCTFERKIYSHDRMSNFVNALHKEMDLRTQMDDFTQTNIYSVYMGGGTASLMGNDAIIQFLSRLENSFGFKRGIECTLECEPATKSIDDFRCLIDAGVNRISVGMQSLDDELLRKLNRNHRSHHSLRMIDDARNAGIPSLHIDLMYGLPNQTFEKWRTTLEQAASLDVDHISAYRLILFKGERLDRHLRERRNEYVPDHTVIDEMYDCLIETMISHGYERYSLTEFAKPDHLCKYVYGNWAGWDYLGFGPGAYSRNSHWLWENTPLHVQFYEWINQRKLPIGQSVKMTSDESIARDLALGLCMLDVNMGEIISRSGGKISADLEECIVRLTKDGLIVRERGTIFLTDLGRRYATHTMKSITNVA